MSARFRNFALSLTCTKQTLNLTCRQIIQITAADKYTRQVAHTFHRGLVKTLLQRHRLTQLCQVATDSTVSIHLHRLVSTVFVRQTHSGTGNHLVKPQTAVRPNVFRLVRVTVQIGTFVGNFALIKQFFFFLV